MCSMVCNKVKKSLSERLKIVPYRKYKKVCFDAREIDAWEDEEDAQLYLEGLVLQAMMLANLRYTTQEEVVDCMKAIREVADKNCQFGINDVCFWFE